MFITQAPDLIPFDFLFKARKDEAEKKRIEALEKKKEREALLAEEAEKEKGKQVR